MSCTISFQITYASHTQRDKQYASAAGQKPLNLIPGCIVLQRGFSAIGLCVRQGLLAGRCCMLGDSVAPEFFKFYFIGAGIESGVTRIRLRVDYRFHLYLRVKCKQPRPPPALLSSFARPSFLLILFAQGLNSRSSCPLKSPSNTPAPVHHHLLQVAYSATTMASTNNQPLGGLVCTACRGFWRLWFLCILRCGTPAGGGRRCWPVAEDGGSIVKGDFWGCKRVKIIPLQQELDRKKGLILASWSQEVVPCEV